MNSLVLFCVRACLPVYAPGCLRFYICGVSAIIIPCPFLSGNQHTPVTVWVVCVVTGCIVCSVSIQDVCIQYACVVCVCTEEEWADGSVCVGNVYAGNSEINRDSHDA